MQLGLFGSPYRATAIQEMRAALNDPRHPVTQEYVKTLVALEMQSDPRFQVPPYDEKNKETWTKIRDADLAEFDRRVAGYIAEVASITQGKSGEARSVTASELLESPASLTRDSRAQLRQMLLSSWDSLPARKQNDILTFHWDEVGGPEWLPVLQRIVTVQSLGSNGQDRSTALFRILELSPELGRQLIVQRIASPKGDIDMGVLGSLPDRELPQMDEVFRARLKRSGIDFGDFPLIGRYASARLLPDIQALYEPGAGRWACSLQSEALRYFLRVSPDYGVKQVSIALHRRGETRCYTTELSELVWYIRIPKLEQITIAALDDTSADVARDAALALQRYGSANAEPALWTRLERIHEKWKHNPNDLLDSHTGMLKNKVDRERERSLVQTITNGQAWFLTEERIRRLKELCSPSTQGLADSFERQLQSQEFVFGFDQWPVGRLFFRLGWYSGEGMTAFKEKLTQFPTGSRIKTSASKTYLDANREELAEVSATAAAHGIVLQIEQR